MSNNAPDHSTLTVVDMISYGVNNGENAHHGSKTPHRPIPGFRSGGAVVVEAEVVVAVAQVEEHAVVVDPTDVYMETSSSATATSSCAKASVHVVCEGSRASSFMETRRWAEASESRMGKSLLVNAYSKFAASSQP